MDPPEGSQSKRFHIKPEFRGNRLSFVASIEPKIVTIEEAAKPTMDQSPLTQQARPEVFEPKVVDLYRRLFKVRITLALGQADANDARKLKMPR